MEDATEKDVCIARLTMKSKAGFVYTLIVELYNPSKRQGAVEIGQENVYINNQSSIYREISRQLH